MRSETAFFPKTIEEVEREELCQLVEDLTGSKGGLLQTHLSFAVPLAIYELRKRSGPVADDYEFAAAFAQTLGEKGDVLLYGGRPGEAAELMGQLTRALAVLAFQPGGVTAFGIHFQANPRGIDPKAKNKVNDHH